MNNIRVHRFDTNPLITREHFSTAKDKHAGENINGPSVIRTPEWLPNRLGRYCRRLLILAEDICNVAIEGRGAGPTVRGSNRERVCSRMS